MRDPTHPDGRPKAAVPSSLPAAPTPRPGDEAPPGTPGTGEDVCPRCGGSGRAEDGTCPVCEGTGKVNRGIGGG